jgi:hypothetical protein
MNPPLTFALTGLRWAVGLVVLLESIHFTLSHSTARAWASMGLPGWIRPALGGAELLAVLLFLLPATRLAGGYLLVMIFAIAAILHVLHGDHDIGGLIVYAMAVLVCVAQKNEEARQSRHDG